MATALAVASLTILHPGHDFAAASGAIDRALALNGSCAAAFYFGAHIHAFSDDTAIAEDYAGKALRLSPFDPLSYIAFYAIGFVRARERRFEDAASYCAKAVQANPRFSTLYAFHRAVLAQAGREEEAKSVASRLLALEPNFRLGPFNRVLSPFFRKDLTEILIGGLRKAGLPE